MNARLKTLLYNSIIFVVIFIIGFIVVRLLMVIFNIEYSIWLILPFYFLVYLLLFKKLRKISNNIFGFNHLENYLAKKQNNLISQINYENHLMSIQNSALKAWQDGNYKESIAIYTNAIQFARNDQNKNEKLILSIFHQNRGNLFEITQNYNKAIFDWETAINFDPTKKEELERKINNIKDLKEDEQILKVDIFKDTDVDFNSSPFFYILDYVLNNHKQIISKKEFEGIQNDKLKLLDEDKSFYANNLKQHFLTEFGSDSGHEANYYEVENSKNPIIISLAFYQQRLVNFNIQIMFKKEKISEYNLLINEMNSYFKKLRSYLNFKPSEMGFVADFGLYKIKYYMVDLGIGTDVNVMMIDKEFL